MQSAPRAILGKRRWAESSTFRKWALCSASSLELCPAVWNNWWYNRRLTNSLKVKLCWIMDFFVCYGCNLLQISQLPSENWANFEPPLISGAIDELMLEERLDSGQGVDHLKEDTICPPTHLPPRFEIDWSDSKRHRNTYWRTQSHNNILIFSNTYLLQCATYISNTKVQGSGKHTYTVCMCICMCMSGCVCKTHTSAHSGILN